MQQAVFVLGPPIAVNVLTANAASGPTAVDVADFFGVLSDVLHNSYFLSFLSFNFRRCPVADSVSLFGRGCFFGFLQLP